VFIGEPLAKPFAPLLRKINPGQFELRFFSPRSGKLTIEESYSAAGPFKLLPKQQATGRGENRHHFKFNEKR